MAISYFLNYAKPTHCLNIMFICVSTVLYDHLPLTNACSNITSNGINHIEISMRHMQTAHTDRHEISNNILNNDINVYSVHGPPIENCRIIDPALKRHFKTAYKPYFEFARELCASVYVEHCGKAGYENWPFLKETVIENCKMLADYAECFSLTLAIENDMDGYGMLKTPEQFLTIIEKVKRNNLKITLDLKHAEHSGIKGISPELFMDKLGDYIVNIHCADLESPAPFVSDWEVPGTGKVKRLDAVLDNLKLKKYNGPITLEINEMKIKAVIEKSILILGDDTDPEKFRRVLISSEFENMSLDYACKYLNKLINGK